jgi:O-antigen/teichoic acid export membrane protein
MPGQTLAREDTVALQRAILRDRALRWGRLLGVFFAGQSMVQGIGLITGFLLIRWLSVDSYAQFSVAFGFQTTIGALADLGFCGSVVALAGVRGKDPDVLGNYIAAALHYRRLILLILFPITLVALPVLMTKQGWGVKLQAALVISVLSSIFAQGYLSLYNAPLLVHQRLKQSYKNQVVANIGRLSLNTILYMVSALSAATASWASSLGFVLNTLLTRKASRELYRKPMVAGKSARQEMLNYVAPLLPGIIFTAFQSQITLFLITTFGKSTSIAEIAALGRLNQLLVILGTLNAVIISPYFANLSHKMLRKRYVQALLASTLVAAAIVGAGFLWPGALLWVLGSKYEHLRQQVSWSILAWAVSYVASVLWSIHSSRKWVYWWVSWVYIVTILITQVILVKCLDLSTTINVIYFSIITSMAVLLVHVANGIYGYNQERAAAIGSK